MTPALVDQDLSIKSAASLMRLPTKDSILFNSCYAVILRAHSINSGREEQGFLILRVRALARIEKFSTSSNNKILRKVSYLTILGRGNNEFEDRPQNPVTKITQTTLLFFIWPSRKHVSTHKTFFYYNYT